MDISYSILNGTYKSQDISSSNLKDISNNDFIDTIENEFERDEQFWIKNPLALTASIFAIFPKEEMSYNGKLNALSRLVIHTTFIGLLFKFSFQIFISGLIALGIIVLIYYFTEKKNNKKNNKDEGFCNFINIGNFYNSPDITNRFTMPKNTNPTMNVLLPEIMNNPNRNMAGPSYNPVIKEEINNSVKNMVIDNFKDESVKDKLFNDLGDNFQFEQSMRNFYTTANTTIPNNQGEFAKFCYGDMISCKEGNNFACIRQNPNHMNI